MSTTPIASPAGPSLLRPMTSRDPEEHPRAATPLELLYDLCYVVAIAQAASSFHHSISEGHAAEGIVSFILVFFAIWWAWMGFTWFASAFDNDDAAYRLKTLLQIVGVLVLAAGVPQAFEHQDFLFITLGYCIMRVGLVAQWLRVIRANPALRRTAQRYALGVTLCQIGWIVLLAVPSDRWMIGWLVLVLLEFLVPIWAEAVGGTQWHPHHISERYGLLTIIVIGESVLAATLAIQAAVKVGSPSLEMWSIIVASPVILFAMWWLYFLEPGHELLGTTRDTFMWGYGHFFVFASAAAVGVGLAVAVDQALGKTHISEFWAGQALAMPVALFLVSVWFVLIRPRKCHRLIGVLFLVGAGLTLLTPLTGVPAAANGLLLTVLTAVVVRISHQHRQLEAH